jgi:hypothetical protein
MRDYFRYLSFFFLGISENLINFICSVVHYYPAFDIQYKFWSKTSGHSKRKFLAKIKGNG